MLAKQAQTFGPDWDLTPSASSICLSCETPKLYWGVPFYLLYGQDARLPTETAISQPLTPYQENLEDYQMGLVAGLSEAWKATRSSIMRAQRGRNTSTTRGQGQPIIMLVTG